MGSVLIIVSLMAKDANDLKFVPNSYCCGVPAVFHTCCGVPEYQEATQKYRQFVKDQFLKDNGQTKYSEIREKSGIKRFRELGGLWIGDHKSYSNSYSKMKTKKYGRAMDQPVPEGYKEIVKLNNDTYEERTVQFYHERGEIDYFFDPEYLFLLNVELNCDETFFIVKNQPETSQMFMIGVQLFNGDNTKTHCQPLVYCFLPDKKTQTYTQIREDIGFLMMQLTNTALAPTIIHMDNEVAGMAAVRSVFPNDHIRTCIWHIRQNLKKKLETLGIGLKNIKKPKYIIDTFDEINGVMYLDLRDEFKLHSVREYLEAIIENEHGFMPDNPIAADKFIEFIRYNLGQWFNRNNVHFLGNNSNYRLNISGGNPILTNNGFECLNFALNQYFKSGGYISNTCAVQGLHNFYC